MGTRAHSGINIRASDSGPGHELLRSHASCQLITFCCTCRARVHPGTGMTQAVTGSPEACPRRMALTGNSECLQGLNSWHLLSATFVPPRLHHQQSGGKICADDCIRAPAMIRREGNLTVTQTGAQYAQLETLQCSSPETAGGMCNCQHAVQNTP